MLTQVLQPTPREKHFSPNKYAKDIVSFQNFTWQKSKLLYDFLRGENNPLIGLPKAVANTPDFVADPRKSKELGIVLRQTKQVPHFIKH